MGFEKEIQAESVEGTSGGEEVSKILDDARKKYGKIQSFRQLVDKENISLIKPQNLPVLNSKKLGVENDYGKYVVKSKEEDSEDHDDVDHLKKKYFPKHKKRRVADLHKANRKSPVRVNESTELKSTNTSEQEIDVKIPTSEDTDVVVKVKPLDNVNLQNKRIHIRVNQKKTPESTKKSKKIVYGTKSVISHHLRKSRPP